MPGLNQIYISGTVSDFDTRTTELGIKSKFLLTNTRNYERNDGTIKTDKLEIWVYAHEGFAEVLIDITNGSVVIVQGRLVNNTWQDEQGDKRSRDQIEAESIAIQRIPEPAY